MPNAAVQFGQPNPETPAEQTARVFADYVNNMGHRNDEFIKALEDVAKSMSSQHRTLQQSFTGVCLAWLKHLSELKEFTYDGRNEASVQIAKRLLDRSKADPDFDVEYDLLLPLI